MIDCTDMSDAELLGGIADISTELNRRMDAHETHADARVKEAEARADALSHPNVANELAELKRVYVVLEEWTQRLNLPGVRASSDADKTVLQLCVRLEQLKGIADRDTKPDNGTRAREALEHVLASLCAFREPNIDVIASNALGMLRGTPPPKTWRDRVEPLAEKLSEDQAAELELRPRTYQFWERGLTPIKQAVYTRLHRAVRQLTSWLTEDRATELAGGSDLDSDLLRAAVKLYSDARVPEPAPCTHEGIGKPGCKLCDPRTESEGGPQPDLPSREDIWKIAEAWSDKDILRPQTIPAWVIDFGLSLLKHYNPRNRPIRVGDVVQSPGPRRFYVVCDTDVLKGERYGQQFVLKERHSAVDHYVPIPHYAIRIGKAAP